MKPSDLEIYQKVLNCGFNFFSIYTTSGYLFYLGKFWQFEALEELVDFI